MEIGETKIIRNKPLFATNMEDLEQIQKVFNKFGVRLIVVYGALLGWYRDKKFLPEDDDIDLAVMDPIDLKTRKAIGWILYDLGFEPQEITFNVFGRMEPAEIGYNGDDKTGIIVCKKRTNFTIFFFYKEYCKTHKEEEYVCIPKLGALKLISTPARFFNKTDTIKIGKEKYLTPSPIEGYLEYSYEDWKDPLMRDHSPTYNQSHPKYQEYIKDILKQNEATIFRNK